MVMVRFTAAKWTKKKYSDLGAGIADQNGKVICAVFATPNGYFINDAENRATIGSVTIYRGRAEIIIPEEPPLIIKRFLLFFRRFPKNSGYKKRGFMRLHNLRVFYEGELIGRVSKIKRSDFYNIDVWKGTNALRVFLTALALNNL